MDVNKTCGQNNKNWKEMPDIDSDFDPRIGPETWYLKTLASPYNGSLFA